VDVGGRRGDGGVNPSELNAYLDLIDSERDSRPAEAAMCDEVRFLRTIIDQAIWCAVHEGAFSAEMTLRKARAAGEWADQ